MNIFFPFAKPPNGIAHVQPKFDDGERMIGNEGVFHQWSLGGLNGNEEMGADSEPMGSAGETFFLEALDVLGEALGHVS